MTTWQARLTKEHRTTRYPQTVIHRGILHENVWKSLVWELCLWHDLIKRTFLFLLTQFVKPLRIVFGNPYPLTKKLSPWHPEFQHKRLSCILYHNFYGIQSKLVFDKLFLKWCASSVLERCVLQSQAHGLQYRSNLDMIQFSTSKTSS